MEPEYQIMIKTIADFAPNNVEAGVGLALQNEQGDYLFFLAGTRHRCPPGELFYAGIGGHREFGESWISCAYREAREEISTDIEILSAPDTWYIPRKGSIRKVPVVDQPRPLALYEMTHPSNTPNAGEIYRIVIYRSRLKGVPNNLPLEELQGVITLNLEQIIQGIKRKPTLAELLQEGSTIMASSKDINHNVRLYPIGTARALAFVLQSIEEESRDQCIPLT